MKPKVVVLYMPVIHVGYVDFLQSHNAKTYLISEEILEGWENFIFLKRDLRRLNSSYIQKLLEGSGLLKDVILLTKENMGELESFEGEIALPDEDVSRWFAEKFLPERDAKFENVFLRWNKPTTLKESQVPADRIITQQAFQNQVLKKAEVPEGRAVSEDESHRNFIKQAEVIAQKSGNWWRQIGSLAVRDGNIVLESYNAFMPSPQNLDAYGDARSDFNAGEHHEISNSIHSEASLIAQAAGKGISLKGADFYVTTFPCPTCAKLLAEAGIKTLFYKEGYSLFDAEAILKNKNIEIVLVK